MLQVDSGGLVAAAFVHRTSRAGDPQLHSHVLVANKVQAAADGKWLSLDGRELFAVQKAAGVLYKAALRAELTRRLSVGWTAVDPNGIAEILGVPAGLAKRWSTRRAQVETEGRRLVAQREQATGRTVTAGERAGLYAQAALSTRAAKVTGEEPTDALRARWQAEAAGWGYRPADLHADLHADLARPEQVPLGGVVAVALGRLEEGSATWTRADSVEVLATLITADSAEGTWAAVEQAAERLLLDGQVVSLAGPLPAEPPAGLRRADGTCATQRHGAPRYTTRATLAREAGVLEAAARGADARAGVVPAGIAEQVAVAAGLGADQAEAVLRLVSGGGRVACLVGPAGAGKSHALAAARLAWQQAGFTVIGLAPSAMAAGVLAEEAGIASDTLAHWLLASDRRPLGPGHVVVVDEASMAATADLAALTGRVETAGAKLVLVGDPHQLGAVGPGGLFATLVADRGGARLETVRRFAQGWERAASVKLRARDNTALAAYIRHGRIHDGGLDDMIDTAYRYWARQRAQDRRVLLMAADHHTVDALALRCRAALVAAGQVEQGGVPTAHGLVGVGDEIVTLRNDRRLVTDGGAWVRNGQQWTVTARGPDGALVAEGGDGQGRVVLPAGYVAGQVALGYCLTVHKAQGATVDAAAVIVEPSMSSEQLYVAMSRGRHDNHALVVTTRPDDGHRPQPEATPAEVLGRVMRRVGNQPSAHQALRAGLDQYDNHRLLTDLLADARERIEQAAGPDRRTEIAALAPEADLDAARQHLTHTEAEARQAEHERQAAEEARAAAATGAPLKARLPGRLGETTRSTYGQQQRAAEARVQEAAARERAALNELARARHAITLTERAAAQLAEARAGQQHRERWLAAHPDETRWAQQLRSRINQLKRETDQTRWHHPPAGQAPHLPPVYPPATTPPTRTR